MHSIARFKGRNHFKMCCDFCAVADFEEGVFLIASPNGTHICQNCVGLSAEIIQGKGIEYHTVLDEPEATP
jgi:hypothetical protein